MHRVHLLVSVTDGREAAVAAAAGSDIIDAKDPSRGALGAVDPEAWIGIRRACPPGTRTSVALGDMGGPLFDASLRAAEAQPPTYVKVGLGGLGEPSSARRALLDLAAGKWPGLDCPGSVLQPAPILIVAGYADHERARAPLPEALPELALAARAGGCLLDTAVKDGSCLFDWIDAGRLGHFVRECRSTGLLCALAGSLRARHLPEVVRLAPDLVGVRGAV
jgi:uncharacterized protein (UPF0264 family)